MVKRARQWWRKASWDEALLVCGSAALILILFLFIELADEVNEAEHQPLEEQIMRWFRTGESLDPIGPGWLADAARDVTALGSVAVLTGLVALAAGYLLLCRRRAAALFVAVAWSWSRAPMTQTGAWRRSAHPEHSAGPFPVWGKVAVVWTVAWWCLAWTRLDGFAPFQRYTFLPLWLGFIVTANAATWRRTGACLMVARSRQWCVLFAVSAGFWWVFEWLNRFVRNWHYLGVEDFGPVAYALHASVCFSTVLPATMAVREWIGSFAGFNRATAAGPRWGWMVTRPAGWTLLVGGAAGLILTGARPNEFYAALWLGPLAMFVGLGILREAPGFWTEIARGDWSDVAAWALAALVCGVFWELWNMFSAAKWDYTVPYVERWHVFEMPLLGYAGYLAFGLECAVVVNRVLSAPRRERFPSGHRESGSTGGGSLGTPERRT